MGYVGWEVDQEEIAEILKIFRPQFPDVIAHHITQVFGVRETYPLPVETKGYLYGYVKDPAMGVECFVVEIGNSLIRPDGQTYHLTWSIDREAGARPAMSNEAIRNSQWEPLPLRVPLVLTPKYFRSS